MKQLENNIYIVLTYTGTALSRLIKCYTKDEFAHVSISLDPKLEYMYSFARVNPYIFFYGGFMHEYKDKGCFKRFSKTVAKIYSLKVTHKQYIKLKKCIHKMENNRKKYKFNIFGLFAAGFDKKISKKNSFYCAEFVHYVMKKSGVRTNLPEVVKPEHFKNISNLREIYSGLLREYDISKANLLGV